MRLFLFFHSHHLDRSSPGSAESGIPWADSDPQASEEEPESQGHRDHVEHHVCRQVQIQAAEHSIDENVAVTGIRINTGTLEKSNASQYPIEDIGWLLRECVSAQANPTESQEGRQD